MGHHQPHCIDLHGCWDQFCPVPLWLCAFLSFASLQYLVDELSSQGLLLSYSSKEKLCDKHRIQVCVICKALEVLGCLQCKSTCGSTCKSGASSALEHSTHKIILLVLSKSHLSWDLSPPYGVSGVSSTARTHHGMVTGAWLSFRHRKSQSCLFFFVAEVGSRDAGDANHGLRVLS